LHRLVGAAPFNVELEHLFCDLLPSNPFATLKGAGVNTNNLNLILRGVVRHKHTRPDMSYSKFALCDSSRLSIGSVRIDSCVLHVVAFCVSNRYIRRRAS